MGQYVVFIAIKTKVQVQDVLLVVKLWSEIWHYFTYISASQEKPTDATRPVCERCFKLTQTRPTPDMKTDQGIQRATG